MNREQIVERVAQRVWSEHYDELSWRQQEEERSNVGCVLEAAGFFDLLEAAKVYHEQYRPGRGVFPALGTCEVCKEPTRTISNKICEKCAWEKLDAAIAKITGVDESDNWGNQE